jgi:predicted 2-oxoglutarate/Fe(II)-dependent dioxygenase YbiX
MDANRNGAIMDLQPIEPIKGLFVYKNALKDADLIPDRLENLIEPEGQHNFFKWSDAQVSFRQKQKTHRDCVDFKVNDTHASQHGKEKKDLKKLYYDVRDPLIKCLDNYRERYPANIGYMEAINFIRYGEGQFFKAHQDHGPSYVAVVSGVIYFNDNYEGGGLYFPHFDYHYTPEAGDILIFPSNYLYLHEAKPVTSGIKYAGVVMFDYNSIHHTCTPAVAGERPGDKKGLQYRVVVPTEKL